MVSFKGIFIRIFSVLICISFVCCEENIDELLIIDYSSVIDREFQFSIGSDLIRTNNFSIDKYISHNLISSVKISILQPNQFKIISQFSLKFIKSNFPINFLIGYNNFSDKLQSSNWLNIGSGIDLEYNKKVFCSFGIYYNTSNKNTFNSSDRCFVSFGLKLLKGISSSILFNYNLDTRYLNKNIEFNIQI